MRKVLCFTLFATLLFNSCTSEEIPDEKQGEGIEILLSVDQFRVTSTNTKTTFRATDDGSVAEQNIANLYIFLFNSTGAAPIHCNVTGPSFIGGIWDKTGGKVTLGLTRAEAGIRQVYIVANYPPAMEPQLAGVTTVTGLQALLQSLGTPWSPSVGTPLLMSGYATHNFTTNRQLDRVYLTRAVAKLELSVSLKTENRSQPIVDGAPQYKYRFIDFDKDTYVLKPSPKPDNLVISSWTNWSETMTNDIGTGYGLNSGVVESLTLVTYLNERDNPGAAVELELPFVGSGALPPPEFGGETYTLVLPAVIERNHWYKYTIN